MAVAIKLKRIGKSLCPVYRVVAIDSKKRTNGEPLEELGNYNPRDKKATSLKKDRIDYWLKVGAVASDTVKNLIKGTVAAGNRG